MPRDARILRRIEGLLGERHIAAPPYETLEVGIGDRVPVDPEVIDCDTMGRRFFRIVPVRAHEKSASGDEHHLPQCALLLLVRGSAGNSAFRGVQLQSVAGHGAGETRASAFTGELEGHLVTLHAASQLTGATAV